MVMDVINLRLPKELIKQLDAFVDKGVYASRSDFAREAIRKEAARQRISKELDSLVGIIPNNGVDSVKEIRELRMKLTEKDYDLDEMNKLGE